MPVMNEWEKSLKLTGDLRGNILAASVKFCFLPLSEIFEELYISLAWDLYFKQTPEATYNLYTENEELLNPLISTACEFNVPDMGSLPAFPDNRNNRYQQRNPEFPYELPLLTSKGRRYGSHQLEEPATGNNKKERALYARYMQLQKDLKIFNAKVRTFRQELTTALDACTTTKQFIDQNPEFEGYMKQSLKKFYSDTHPNVIDSLNSAMNVRMYASLTSGHRLQAYQTSMLEQLERLPSLTQDCTK